MSSFQNVCSKELTSTQAKVERYYRLPVKKVLKKLKNNITTDQSCFATYRHFEILLPFHEAGTPIFYDTSRENLRVLHNINLRV
jgi:hypothetical protein